MNVASRYAINGPSSMFPPHRTTPLWKQGRDRSWDSVSEAANDFDEFPGASTIPEQSVRQVPGDHPTIRQLDRGPSKVRAKPFHHPGVHDGVGEEWIDGEHCDRPVELPVFEPRPLHVGARPYRAAKWPNDGRC